MTNPVEPPQVPYRGTDEDTPADFLAPAPVAPRTEAPKPRKGGWWKTLLILLVIVAALCAAAVPLYNHFFAPAGAVGSGQDETAMVHVLLSADGDVYVCLVPGEVAADLPGWADHFREWMRTAPEASQYRETLPGGQVGLVFTEQDFLHWLSEVALPDTPCTVVENLGPVNPQELTDPLNSYPFYNF